MRWRSIATGRGSGAFNMSVDDTLLGLASDSSRDPILRLFGWSSPTVTVGHGQLAGRDLDLVKCQEAGIDVVRRPTGGRAVLHCDELTYSVVLHEKLLPESVSGSSRLIGECLAYGLRLYGVDAALESPAMQSRLPHQHRTLQPKAPCFSTLSRNEVKIKGRKLVGSAQRRARGAVLHHGSILLGSGHKRILDLMRPMSDFLRQEQIRELEEKCTDLRSCCRNEIDLGELSRCLIEGFASTLDVSVSEDSLTAKELGLADELIRSKYRGQPGTGARTATRRPQSRESS